LLFRRLKNGEERKISKKIGSITAKLLRDPKTPKSVKSIASKVSTQQLDRRKTTKKKK